MHYVIVKSGFWTGLMTGLYGMRFGPKFGLALANHFAQSQYLKLLF